jgi:hypothetical protein
VKIEGLQSLTKKLKEHERKLANGIQKGLKKAGDYLLQQSLEVVPTDDMDLYNSGFSRTVGKGFEAEQHVGYGQEYATDVHEDLEVRHGESYNSHHAAQIAAGSKYFYKGRYKTYHPRRPKEQVKFLEQPLRENLDVIEGIIRHGVFSALK